MASSAVISCPLLLTYGGGGGAGDGGVGGTGVGDGGGDGDGSPVASIVGGMRVGNGGNATRAVAPLALGATPLGMAPGFFTTAAEAVLEHGTRFGAGGCSAALENSTRVGAGGCCAAVGGGVGGVCRVATRAFAAAIFARIRAGDGLEQSCLLLPLSSENGFCCCALSLLFLYCDECGCSGARTTSFAAAAWHLDM